MLPQVMLAEYDAQTHEALKSAISWKKAGFDTPVSVYNGHQVLGAFQEKPFDIIFINLKMPAMDGLSVIKKIKEHNPNQNIVVISDEECPEKALSAYQSGADGYIIKNQINAPQLYALICGAKKTAPPLPSTLGKGGRQLGELFTRLANKEPLTRKEQLYLSRHLKLGEHTGVCVMCLTVEDYPLQLSKMGREEASLNLLRLRSGIRGHSAALCQLADHRWLAVYPVGDPREASESLRSAAEISESLRAFAQQCGFSGLCVGVSEPAASLQELTAACGQAQQAAQKCILFGVNRTHFYDGAGAEQEQRVNGLLEEIRQALLEGQEVQQAVHSLFAPRLDNGFQLLHYNRYVSLRLQGLADELLTEGNWSAEEFARHSGMHPQDAPERYALSGVLAEYYNRFFTRLGACISTGEGHREENILMRAKRVIEEHYEEEISLNFVADELGVHKGYLCRVFKAKTGENMIDYIQNKKVDRAKRLLELHGMRIAEISKMLGFSTPQYFSMVFKRRMGQSPNEYRKSLAHSN